MNDMADQIKKENAEEKPRIGVFVCDCGSNIAGHLDCESVAEYASTLPGVVFTKENLYTCSESGIAEIQQSIKEHHLTRVVVASCSPRTHQPLFAGSCAQAGLNPYLFEMVNIRDQCSWVHMGQRENATEKAKNLVRMGVAKSVTLEPQKEIESSLIRKVLVIGGGMAGLSAADAFAAMGIEVILVEKSGALGGLLRKINRLANGEAAIDVISNLIEKVESRSNISVYTGSEVKSIGGYIGNFNMTVSTGDKNIEESAGCVVVATGALPWVPEGLYGYNGEGVITQIELEDRLKTGALNASQIVMIQCAGARTNNREFCSRICCMTAVKNALIIKEYKPDSEIHILYRDMQMYGTEKEKMLWDARGKGIRFHVFDKDKPPDVKNGKVHFFQPLLGETREIPCDLVVLSTPLLPNENARNLARTFRVPVDQNGFFLEAHAKLRPLDFAADGIFLCGSARYPATTAEARSQGIGVASRAAGILFKEKLVTSAIVAGIRDDTCVGCMICLNACPYQAISFNEISNVCEVNVILCKGCGNCAAACPSHSARLKGFMQKQVLAQIRAF